MIRLLEDNSQGGEGATAAFLLLVSFAGFVSVPSECHWPLFS